MDIRKVKKLIELLEESNIGEIEIKEGEESVRISRYGNQLPPRWLTRRPRPLYRLWQHRCCPAEAAPEASAPAAAPVADNAVLSPMVGTFYRARAPMRPLSLRSARLCVSATCCALSKP